MSAEEKIKIEEGSIRKKWIENDKKWHFSVVDIVGLISESKDARNYWKVLKSRLNKTNKELVTRCNQLKLPSNDGKSYLTDTAEVETILEIIEIINPIYTKEFRLYFESLEETYPHVKESFLSEFEKSEEEIELPINMYQTDNTIFIEALVAGAGSNDIFISVNYKNIIIKGKRILPKDKEKYLLQEIYWGGFSRNLELPSEIQIDEVIATNSHGFLKIELPKIDTLRKRVIKIKSI